MMNENKINMDNTTSSDILKSNQRTLIYKFNSAYARKRVGKFFGFECKVSDIEKSKWNHYIVAFFIFLNMKLYRSKLLDYIPNKLLFIYICFLRSLNSF
jgi:hypothetical protein